MFRSDRFADISLNQWMALLPPDLVRAHVNLDPREMRVVAGAKDKPIIVR
jgi:oxalate decarboxylase